jgi:hypothetical protein
MAQYPRKNLFWRIKARAVNGEQSRRNGLPQRPAQHGNDTFRFPKFPTKVVEFK